MWTEFESWRQHHMWVEFVVGSDYLALRGFSPGTPVFRPLLKNQHFQIPIHSGTKGHVSTSSYEFLRASWVNKLQNYKNYYIEGLLQVDTPQTFLLC